MLVSEALLSGVEVTGSDCPTVKISTTQAQSLRASAAVAHNIGERLKRRVTLDVPSCMHAAMLSSVILPDWPGCCP